MWSSEIFFERSNRLILNVVCGASFVHVLGSSSSVYLVSQLLYIWGYMFRILDVSNIRNM